MGEWKQTACNFCGVRCGFEMVYEADEDNIDIMIFWGSNSYVSHQIVNARTVIRERSEKEGQMVIVVNPRLSETARMSDLHVHPKPGYDALMIRGMISLILDKGWQDQEFLDKYCTGWERARSAWYDGFDYKAAFDLCGVPLAQMEEFCRLLSHRTWGVHQDLGLFCGRHSTLNSNRRIQGTKRYPGCTQGCTGGGRLPVRGGDRRSCQGVRQISVRGIRGSDILHHAARRRQGEACDRGLRQHLLRRGRRGGCHQRGREGTGRMPGRDHKGRKVAFPQMRMSREMRHCAKRDD